jgi:uncharacterized protein YcbK (DUF882 family)
MEEKQMTWKYFHEDEFTCQCGCGRNKIKEAFVNELERTRAYAGIPFTINSGYRCPAHNKASGGKPTSAHLFGWAADVACRNSHERFIMLNAFIWTGTFNRIGIASSFIHVDVDDMKPEEVVWVY